MSEMKRKRRAKGLTALELARRAGSTEDRVYQLERGRYRPRADEAERLAHALKSSVKKMFPAGTQPDFGKAVTQ